MANSLLQPSEITAIPLAIAHTSTRYIKTVNRDYADLFGNAGVALAGKVGQQIALRLPNQYTIRRGSAASIQDNVESSVALTISTIVGIDTQFFDNEEALVVSDYTKRYAEPQGMTMAATIDNDTIQNTYSSIPVAFCSGTNGIVDFTSQATVVQSILTGKQRMSEQNVPQNDSISIVIPPVAETRVAAQYWNTFNPQPTISRINMEGLLSHVNGLDWWMDQSMPVLTTGTAVRGGAATQVQATVATEGQAYITLKNSANATVIVGESFTVGTTASNPVYAVNPQTKYSTGQLQSFSVVAPPSGTTVAAYTAASGTTPGYYTLSSGGVNVYVSFNSRGGLYSSVSGGNQNVSAMPAANATVSFAGAASTAYANLVLLHKSAVTFGAVRLDAWKGMDASTVASYDGLSMRYLRGGDIVNGRKIARFDALYGSVACRPEFASRLFMALS